MNLYLNTTNGQLATSPGGATPVRKLTVKRGDQLDLEIFADGELPAGTTAVFAARPRGVYSGGLVLLATGWSAPATSGEGYRLVVPVASDPLEGLFTDEVPMVPLMAELSIQLPEAAYPLTSQTFDLEVVRDLYQGGEVPPVAVPPPTEFSLSATDGSIWRFTVSAEGQFIRTRIQPPL